MKFYIKDFFCKCDNIRWKSLMQNFIFLCSENIKSFEKLNAILAHRKDRILSRTLQQMHSEISAFFYLGMLMRIHLAVRNFNSGSGLEQARLKREKKYNVCFLKIPKRWSSKPIKAKKDNSCLKELVPECCFQYHSSS